MPLSSNSETAKHDPREDRVSQGGEGVPRRLPPPVKRKYVMVKIARGDYLLPGNDGKTVWRLTTYEDGIEQGLDHDLGTVWGVWKWLGTNDTVDPDLWDLWSMWSGSHSTRADAIQAALRQSA